MSRITTHVLDTARGRPAAGIRVRLERLAGEQWQVIGAGVTDDEGRLRTLVADDASLLPGVHRLGFGTAAYFQAHGTAVFYPHVSVEFEVADGEVHYHLPLLLSPYGYTTYRGT